MRLQGRVAFITGAAGGIGQSTVKRFLREGAKVIACDRDDLSLQRLKSSLPETQSLHLRSLNVSSRKDVELAVQAGLDVFGQIDILINNAGISPKKQYLDYTDDDWNAVIAIDLTAAFLICRAALRPMLRQRFGRIVNVSSVSGVIGNAGQSNYSAAKAGLIGLTKSLAREVASRDITVNAVAPGFIETEMVAKIPQPILDGIIEKVPIRRLGRPDEVARVVRFLLEEESAYITGAMYAVNGGMFM